MEALERMPFTAQKKIFEKVAKIADCRSLSKADQEKYNQSRNAIDDYYSGLVGAWLEGEAKGISKGELNKSLGIAKRMLAAGLPDAQITEFTDLSQEQLDKIKN